MTESNYWRRLTHRRLVRRSFLRSGGIAAFGLGAAAVAGCGGSKTTANNTNSSPGGTAVSKTTGGSSAAQPVMGGILNGRMQTDPATLDIHQASTYSAVWPEAPAYNQLVQFDPQDPDNKVIPDLADSYEIANDGLSITFKLHPGVKFHDGSDFTSEDVKANVDWIKNPPAKKASPRQGVFDPVIRVETPDPLTAKMVLQRPYPSLIVNLATDYLAMGAKADLAQGDLGQKMNGTGPFKLKSYTRGVGTEMERNPNYFVQGRPYLDGVKYSIVPDENTAFTSFLGGQFQRFYPVLPENVDRVAKETGGKAKDVSLPSTLRDNLFFNGTKKPYDDIRVRQAISMVIDRMAGIQVVQHGFGAVGGYMVPGGQWAISTDQLKKVPGYDKPDLAEAKKLLAAAGVTDPLSGSILTRTDQLFRDCATFVQGTLQKAFGWNFTIDAKDSAAGYDAAYASRFDLLAWTVATTIDDPDATFAEVAITKAVRNWSKVYDTEADAIYNKQSQTLDTAQRKQLVQQLETKFLNDFQVLSIYFQKPNHAIYNTIQNYKLAQSLYVNQRYQDLWLSKA
ncbi:MAG: ABC transporter substrate-binding protein [Dehalococcoidia bacterium]